MYEYLQIGEIVNTHGVRGELKVIPLTDDPGRYDDLKDILVDKHGEYEKYDIEAVRYHKGSVILKLKGINDMTAAETLKGLFLLVDRENAVKLPENSYFICDLIGITVKDDRGVFLGVLSDILQTGSNDVFVIRDKGNNELLLPALKSVVTKISAEEGVIQVKIPEGLQD